MKRTLEDHLEERKQFAEPVPCSQCERTATPDVRGLMPDSWSAIYIGGQSALLFCDECKKNIKPIRHWSFKEEPFILEEEEDDGLEKS